MKKISVLLFACLFIISSPEAQVKPKSLKQVSILKMPRMADDDMPGKRGACVVWHPKQKKYYAAMAGNAGFPVAVFDATGKMLSSDDDDVLIDVRGLWYNADKNRIEGNGFDDVGWFYYKLDEKGQITDYEVLFEGLNQPDEQTVGAYNYKDNKILFLKGSQVYTYNITDAKATGDELTIHWGRTEKEGATKEEDTLQTPDEYNRTTVVYSDLAEAELGVLNITKLQVEFYNIKMFSSGYLALLR